MAFVSKKPLSKETLQAIKKQFLQLSGGQKSKETLAELLTDTEFLMLAKRMATILMLIDGYSYYRIQQALGVSVSTSKRLHSLLIGGSFTHLEKITSNKKRRTEIESYIGLILRGGLPQYGYVIKKRKKT